MSVLWAHMTVSVTHTVLMRKMAIPVSAIRDTGEMIETSALVCMLCTACHSHHLWLLHRIKNVLSWIHSGLESLPWPRSRETRLPQQ